MPNIHTVMHALYPNLSPGGFCYAYAEAMIRVILSNDIPTIIQRHNLLYYGPHNPQHNKIQAIELKKLLEHLAGKPSQLREKKSQPPKPSEAKLPEPFTDLFRKFATCDASATITPEEEKYLLSLAYEDPEQQTFLAPLLPKKCELPSEELEEQLALAEDIRSIHWQKTHKTCVEDKEFTASHPYVAELNDAQTYLSTMAVTQFPQKFPELFHPERQVQYHNPLNQWFQPVGLENKTETSLAMETENFASCYSSESLQQCLDFLEKQLLDYAKKITEEKKPAADYLPFALKLATLRHTLVVSYHPQTKWHLFSPNEPFPRTLDTKQLGQEVLANILSTTDGFTISGKNLEFTLAYHPTSQKVVLRNITKIGNPKGHPGVEKMLLTLINSNDILTLPTLTQHIHFKAYAHPKARKNIAPFLSVWRESQKVTADMIVTDDDLDHCSLLNVYCAKGNNTQFLDLLIQTAGNKINPSTIVIAFLTACRKNNILFAIHLIKKHHVDPNSLDNDKEYALLKVVAKGYYNLVIQLVVAGATLQSGLIFKSCVKQNEDMTRLLISLGANLTNELKEYQGARGFTEAIKKHCFTYYVIALTRQIEFKDILSALRKIINSAIDLPGFFDPTTKPWDYLETFHRKPIADSTEIPELEAYLLKQVDWQDFWKSMHQHFPQHKKELQTMQEKILFAFRQRMINSSLSTHDKNRLKKYNCDLLNLRLHPAPIAMMSKFIKYTIKHIMRDSQSSPEDQLFFISFDKPRSNYEESDILSLLSYFRCDEEKSRSTSALFQSVNKPSRIKSSPLVNRFIKQLEKIISPRKLSDEKKEQPGQQDFVEKEKISREFESLVLRASKLKLPTQPIIDFWLFAEMGLCSFPEALDAIHCEYPFGELSTDRLAKAITTTTLDSLDRIKLT